MLTTQKMAQHTENGMMSLKVCEMLGGTCSGILMVMLRLMKNLYTMPTTNAEINAVRRPLEPR